MPSAAATNSWSDLRAAWAWLDHYRREAHAEGRQSAARRATEETRESARSGAPAQSGIIVAFRSAKAAKIYHPADVLHPTRALERYFRGAKGDILSQHPFRNQIDIRAGDD